IESEDLKTLGYKNSDDLAAAIADGKVALSKLELIKPWFALAPPRKGFKKQTKRMYQEGGIVGENQDLPSLVRNMI
ncbi:MAG: 50S ribosomal protein L30, partial [Nitrososphaerales archaeon]